MRSGHGRRPTGISREARQCLPLHHWPGNVRELENALQRAVVLGSSDCIRTEDLPGELVEAATPPSEAGSSYHEAVRQANHDTMIRRRFPHWKGCAQAGRG